MYNWYDRACEEIESDYNDGLIDFDEYNYQMWELNRELDEARRQESGYGDY